MTPNSIWTRWKRLAHRAAEVQAFVILTALYWTVVAPIGLLSRRRKTTAEWRVREATKQASLSAARRQY